MTKRTTFDRAKEYKNDFMAGGGKAGHRDPLTKQKPSGRRYVSQEEITRMYANNQIVQNIIDIPAEDCTREWITIEMENEKLARGLEQKLQKLKAQEAFEKMVGFDRLRGDGFVSIGSAETGNWELQDPLNVNKLRKIDYLHGFSSNKITKFEVLDDPFHPNYGDVEFYQVNSSGMLAEMSRQVHRSRLLHMQSKKLEDDHWGQPMLEPMWDILTVFDTSVWSVGQILYDYTFKVFSSDQAEGLTKEELRETQMLTDFMFRTEALALIGQNETLSKESTQVQGIDQLLNFVWELLSGSARMPKSHLLGQQAGTISGAQYDSLNYYARIAGIQENFIRPKIEYLVRLLLWASDEAGGQIDPDSFEWNIKFNPLWKLDDQTDADIRKKTAETDAIYLKNMVITPDEVREKRYNMDGMMGELGYSEEEAAEVNEMIQQAQGANGDAGS
ncbi:phage-related protein (TIGR01555 family) [Salibacterium salarium]|uniref:DUF1073 domain-containing protein n=1 Tax=Salibacterium salarium TaxID=284579 RepID=UPI002785FCA2|nr:anti-CBASS Acb1 family protein [Salibacterium salarium]MDQ0299650.1 phage-related protein (TIGR01555 family) [Salibacterium salarium]